MPETKVPDDYQLDPETSAKLNDMLKKARAAGKKIGLSEKFLDDLMNDLRSDNDWSFVIKVHALMEVAITHVISERLHITGSPIGYRKEEISDFISRLPMNGRNGKVNFANSLNLMNKATQNFLEKLSEIRNFYAHDLRNLDIPLEQYAFEINKHRQHEFYAAFFPGYPENKELADSLPTSAFKLYIFMGLCLHLSIIDVYSKPPPSILGSFLDDDDEEKEEIKKAAGG